MLTRTLIPLLLSTTVSASPAPPITPRDSLQPWQLLTLYTHSPSGRPGNDPHSTLNATIHDPNTIPAAPSPTGEAVFPPSTANCSAQWLSAADVPYDVPQPCTEIDYGYWTMTVTRGSGEAGYAATEDFGLVFRLVDNVTVIGETVVKTFTGSGKFKVGVNLEGTCGGSGVCNWGLDGTPYDVQQTEESS